ncbi:MAG: hypothetical protein HYR66_12410 [Sphingobacteriales bacterium]|nr:hypothetical protein [Sphingobacteriales bacterium]MBI3720222.1 hypothetical protein [Sphingobacteriales bacterium]
MKKTFFTIILFVILGLTFFYFKYIYGWMEFRKNTDTPAQFLNTTINKKEDYSKDSLKISVELKELLLRHESEDFFYSKEYFEGTEIIIDTIVYSPDFSKLGVLILTKNPTTRQLMPIKNEKWYYDATSYLGIRQGDSISLSYLGPGFTNSSDKQEQSKYIRNACFRIFVSKDTTEKYAHKYNFNDVRFWTSSEWQKIEDDKIKKKEFEEEKIKHPENIYEPPKR